SQSLWLRPRGFAFLDGNGLFDWRPLTDQYLASPTPQSADARAIAFDLMTTYAPLCRSMAEPNRRPRGQTHRIVQRIQTLRQGRSRGRFRSLRARFTRRR